MKQIQTDVLVIGAGLAGLYTALHVDRSLSVAVISKDVHTVSNSSLAQGGIAGKMTPSDSFESHVLDTLKAGSFINDRGAVQVLVESAPEEIHHLIEMGVDFDKNDQGELLVTLEGGHSQHRILHAHGDATGRAIMETVLKELSTRSNIIVYDNTMATSLLMEDGAVAGASLLKDGKPLIVYAKKTVLASGGIGGLYTNTTNQKFSTGDGIALAHQAGIDMLHLCYIQFHPTAFYDPDSDKRFLISEAVRGEGALLLDRNRERFMPKLHELAELDPRDIVSQSMYKVMQLQQTEFLYLDCRHMTREFLTSRFPTIYEHLAKNGFHMEKDLIPVTPVSHYFVGGIKVDLIGRTNVPNIYACGEVANTGVHGANRLASNSLLECIVFGSRIAQDINRQAIGSLPPHPLAAGNPDPYAYLNDCTAAAGEQLKEIKRRLRVIMTDYVGIIRTDSRLKEALRLIDSLDEAFSRSTCRSFDYFETRNMLTVARLIAEDALRSESIGCHYKIDTLKE